MERLLLLVTILTTLLWTCSSEEIGLRYVNVTAEQGCGVGTHINGLQCAQVVRDEAFTRFTSFRIHGAHKIGSKTDLTYQSIWSTALQRDESDVPQTSASPSHHTDIGNLPSTVQPSDSSTKEPVRVKIQVNAPRIAMRLEKIRDDIPHAFYFDTKVATDDFVGNIDLILSDPAQRSLFINGSMATCGGEPVMFSDTLGTPCSRLMGLGGAGDYFDDANTNNEDDRIRGTNPDILYGSSEFMRVPTDEASSDCFGAICYPCGAANITRETLVRAMPVGPTCSAFHVVDVPEILVDGEFILEYNVTLENGEREERVVTIGFDSLYDGLKVHQNKGLSATISARLVETLRKRHPTIAPGGVIITCGATSTGGLVSMGATNPYVSNEFGFVSTDLGVSPFDGSGAFNTPFFHLSTQDYIQKMASNTVCSNAPNMPSKLLYSDEYAIGALCASVATQPTKGYGVPGFQGCDATEITPAQIFSSLNAWQAEYLALDPEDRLAFPRSPYLPRLWNAESPNVWLHTPENKHGSAELEEIQSMYMVVDPIIQRDIEFDIDVHIHEGLINVIDPGEINPATKTVSNATAAPIIVIEASGCHAGGLLLDQVGLTGVDYDGDFDPSMLEGEVFGFSLSLEVCNIRNNNATYRVTSNCSSPYVYDSFSSAYNQSIVHSEVIVIDRDIDTNSIGGPDCYTFTTPFYVGDAVRLRNFSKSLMGTIRNNYLSIGGCTVNITSEDGSVIYQPTLDGKKLGDVRTQAVDLILDTVTASANSSLAMNCVLDTTAVNISELDEEQEEDEEKRQYLRIVVLSSSIVGITFLFVIFMIVMVGCISRSKGSDLKPPPTDSKR